MGNAMDPATTPATQRALVIDDKDQAVIWAEAPCPKLPPDQVLLRTEAVGLNPSDTKMRGSFVTPFATLGADYAGTVVAVGSDVNDVKIGDRVCGAQNEMCALTPEWGAFGEYNVTRGRMWMKIPDSWSTEAAASLPVGISTSGIALRLLGLPLPDKMVPKPVTVLVYGGSTATATIAMQMMRLSGIVPIATCSPKNFDLAKKNGAAEVFDYHDKDLVEKIRTYTKGNLKYVLDCITNVESTTVSFAAIGRAGGKYVSLDPFPEHAASRKVVKTDWVVGPLIFGEGSTWPEPWGRPGSEELRDFGVELWGVAQKLVQEGKLHHHPLRVLDGGLENISQGMELVRSKKLSGEKVVVRFRGASEQT
ncbi:enoyl reductase [Diaporthe helianthi]|uniref:Enoyl reductase n=1 Tax=Diaporthe helianthi TaxID=158607 RepID=A0A2P5HZY4_DIAHE|nr:enoyl reductase [Diaporthe helianthi]